MTRWGGGTALFLSTGVSQISKLERPQQGTLGVSRGPSPVARSPAKWEPGAFLRSAYARPVVMGEAPRGHCGFIKCPDLPGHVDSAVNVQEAIVSLFGKEKKWLRRTPGAARGFQGRDGAKGDGPSPAEVGGCGLGVR